MTESPETTGFAPADLTDGRTSLEWRSKYSDSEARRGIRLEGLYLGLTLAFLPVAMLLVWLELPQRQFELTELQNATITRYALAWLGGTLGGTLFSIKWLYHVVAKQLWHLDRRLWRLFTPHLSGGLAFAVFTMVSSGILSIFNTTATSSPSLIVGSSFLVGYFSDNATAKLHEVAVTLFGTNRLRGRQRPDGPTDDHGSSEQ